MTRGDVQLIHLKSRVLFLPRLIGLIRMAGFFLPPKVRIGGIHVFLVAINLLILIGTLTLVLFSSAPLERWAYGGMRKDCKRIVVSFHLVR